MFTKYVKISHKNVKITYSSQSMLELMLELLDFYKKVREVNS